MKREVRNLYSMMLRPDGSIINLRLYIKYYDEYNKLADKIENDTLNVPRRVRSIIFGSIPKPVYIEWIKTYMK
jgi:hypothetical protein